MNSTDEMYKYAYVPIQGVPEYIDFTFSVNWIAIYTLITITYSIPCTVVLIRLVYFHFNHKKSYGIFNAFVHMQLLTTFLGFSDFLAVRIPSCGVFTSYCASRDPQWYMKISTFLYYGSSFSGQLLTVMFCGMRVVYLYFPAYVQKKFENSFNICSLITILISFLVAFPNFLSSGVCLQLVPPFPYGALVILSMFHYGNLVVFNLSYFLFSTIVMIAILICTYSVFRKLGERRNLSTVTKSVYNMKVEKTLSMTVTLILIPLAFNQIMAIGEILNDPFLSYFLLIRPVVQDWRIHIVTMYFYYTHPALKKPKVAVIKSTV